MLGLDRCRAECLYGVDDKDKKESIYKMVQAFGLFFV